MNECKKEGVENMERSICGADCAGCAKSNGSPFGKKCFVYEYIRIGGKENYRLLKERIVEEFNALSIAGMPKIDALFPRNGASVNLAYPMPNGGTMKLLDDNEIYLGNQVRCEFDDGDSKKCFGMVAGKDFLLVSEYDENGTDAQLILYKMR